MDAVSVSETSVCVSHNTRRSTPQHRCLQSNNILLSVDHVLTRALGCTWNCNCNIWAFETAHALWHCLFLWLQLWSLLRCLCVQRSLLMSVNRVSLCVLKRGVRTGNSLALRTCYPNTPTTCVSPRIANLVSPTLDVMTTVPLHHQLQLLESQSIITL
jgi:hypothetical protein